MTMPRLKGSELLGPLLMETPLRVALQMHPTFRSFPTQKKTRERTRAREGIQLAPMTKQVRWLNEQGEQVRARPATTVPRCNSRCIRPYFVQY